MTVWPGLPDPDERLNAVCPQPAPQSADVIIRVRTPAVAARNMGFLHLNEAQTVIGTSTGLRGRPGLETLTHSGFMNAFRERVRTNLEVEVRHTFPRATGSQAIQNKSGALARLKRAYTRISGC